MELTGGMTSRAGPSIPLSDLAVDDEILAAVRDVVASGWWSAGPRVAEFERAFAAFVGAEHAIAVSSGTAALHLALVDCGCGVGDEVILPSLNFVAAANAVRHTGARPVFCDIRANDDPNLDPGDLEAAAGPRTKAIVALHYAGFACDMDAVLALAAERELVVIEDAAHAPGALYGGRACGTLGHVGCFSFFANKNLPIGEGGMVVTDDAGVAERVRRLRSHGMTTMTWDRERGHAAGYDVVATGFNFRMDEIRAAIGLVQLGRLPAANAARARLAAHYWDRLHAAGLTMAPDDPAAREGGAHHLAVVVLPDGAERAQIRADLAARGIQTSVHYPPIHRFTAYQEAGGARVAAHRGARRSPAHAAVVRAHARRAGRRGRRRAAHRDRRTARRRCARPAAGAAMTQATHSHALAGAPTERPLICIQGLGFVGSAMAVAVADARTGCGEPCFDVIGVDLATPDGRAKVDAINSGRLPVAANDERLARALAAAHERGNLTATTDERAYERAAVTVVDVPLDVIQDNGHPTVALDDLRAAIRTLASRMPSGSLIVVETTVPPGTTEKIIVPEVADAVRERGLAPDAIGVAYSYERVMPGASYFDSIVDMPRSYAGHSAAAADACEAFLSKLIDVDAHPLTRLASTTACETAKVLENSYRATLIAFMEEWGRFAEEIGIDLHEVISTIRRRPTHSNMRRPGFGVGGYCLTKDPLLAGIAAHEFYGRTDLSFPFSTLAVEVNRAMPLVSLRKVEEMLRAGLDGATILLMGVSYREDVADTRYFAVRDACSRGAAPRRRRALPRPAGALLGRAADARGA